MSFSPDRKLRVLFVTPELAPFAKAGGLGDVSGALPVALAARGIDVRIVVPLYAGISRDNLSILPQTIHVNIGSTSLCAKVHQGLLHQSVPVYFPEQNSFFDRPHIYGPSGGAYADNLERYTFLSRAALKIARIANWTPDIIHANDWQTALLPLLVNEGGPFWDFSRSASVLTIHNVGYQGNFPANLVNVIGQGAIDGSMEDRGQLNLLKAGVSHSTMVSTVSPSYADEILTPEHGCGLDYLMRARKNDLVGILNGIDTTVWNPQTDRLIPAQFSREDLSGKDRCKLSLQQECGLPQRADLPIFAVIARLTTQKGIDVLAHAMSRILELDLQMVVLGEGDPQAERFFRSVQVQRPDRFSCLIGFNEGLSHRIEAGADFFIMPSRYEPCGLNQMYSQNYGTLPVVRATGGLRDTVQNYDEATGRGTGFTFNDLTPKAIADTVTWAYSTWRNRPHHIAQMRRQAMSKDFSWTASAEQYERLYRRAVAKRLGAEDLYRTAVYQMTGSE